MATYSGQGHDQGRRLHALRIVDRSTPPSGRRWPSSSGSRSFPSGLARGSSSGSAARARPWKSGCPTPSSASGSRGISRQPDRGGPGRHGTRRAAELLDPGRGGASPDRGGRARGRAIPAAARRHGDRADPGKPQDAALVPARPRPPVQAALRAAAVRSRTRARALGPVGRRPEPAGGRALEVGPPAPSARRLRDRARQPAGACRGAGDGAHRGGRVQPAGHPRRGRAGQDAPAGGDRPRPAAQRTRG